MTRKHTSFIESTRNYIKVCQTKNKKYMANIMSRKTYEDMLHDNKKKLIIMLISSL